jgi:hypothetical protein
VFVTTVAMAVISIATTIAATAVVVSVTASMVIAAAAAITLFAATPAMITVVIALAMLFAVARHVFVSVPVIAHEVDTPAAGVVSPAMLAPVLLVARWHTQIDGLFINNIGIDSDRLFVNHPRLWKIADVDLTVKAGLADVDGYADGGKRGHCKCGKRRGNQERFQFHVSVLLGRGDGTRQAGFAPCAGVPMIRRPIFSDGL